MKHTIKILCALVVLAAALGLALIGCGDTSSGTTGNTTNGGRTGTNNAEITTFEECAAAGNPVMESYPARCIANGKQFVQKIDDPDKLNPPTVSTSTGGFEEVSTTLRLKAPHTNDAVRSPLAVAGEAGGWYFEGEFPVRLLDGQGAVIAQGSAVAQGDWMTMDLVPFQLTLTFTQPTTATGILVFEKSNPRGEGPAQTEQIPVQFAP